MSAVKAEICLGDKGAGRSLEAALLEQFYNWYVFILGQQEWIPIKMNQLGSNCSQMTSAEIWEGDLKNKKKMKHGGELSEMEFV